MDGSRGTDSRASEWDAVLWYEPRTVLPSGELVPGDLVRLTVEVEITRRPDIQCSDDDDDALGNNLRITLRNYLWVLLAKD